jgi:hypothetical protein
MSLSKWLDAEEDEVGHSATTKCQVATFLNEYMEQMSLLTSFDCDVP